MLSELPNGQKSYTHHEITLNFEDGFYWKSPTILGI